MALSEPIHPQSVDRREGESFPERFESGVCPDSFEDSVLPAIGPGTEPYNIFLVQYIYYFVYVIGNITIVKCSGLALYSQMS